MTIYTTERLIEMLQERVRLDAIKTKYVMEENEKIKAEVYKDAELQKMKAELEQMKADYYRGFAITEDEEKRIKAWQKKHEEEVHGLKTDKDRLKAQGCCGGRYSYHFIPTAIGTSGVVRCSCGAEFEFQEI